MIDKKRRAGRERTLLLDALDNLTHVGCQFFACRGFLSPPASMQTCRVCWTLRRAYQMGLIDKKGKTLR